MNKMNILKSVLSNLGGIAGKPCPISLDDFGLDAERPVLTGRFTVQAPIVFAPSLDLAVRSKQGAELTLRSSEAVHLNWLPRGTYEFHLALPASFPTGPVELSLSASHQAGMTTVEAERREKTLSLSIGPRPTEVTAKWSVEAVAPTQSIGSLSWNKGHSDWFFRHFDHAAATVISYLLGDSPLLRGRILDIGCGDGITDLGVALRTQCTQFVGTDPFKQYERLPQIVADNGLPPDIVPSQLSFRPEDANFLPFEDNSFDVVISWGSVEHMAGGYLQALREVKRVLVPDGLFLVAPGLFYSNIGHHLDEFSSEPYFHLKKSPEEVRQMVLQTPPKYIDRSGEFATNEQYWKWHCELNRITVTEFEKQLRALEFEPWRVALRTNPLVEYTPELQQYSIEQLANTELYMSCVNKKKLRS